MQTIDMNVIDIVCHPFEYGEFSSESRIVKYVVAGFGICSFTASARLFVALVSLAYVMYDPNNIESIDYQRNEIFNAVIILLAKIIYSLAIVRMGY